MEKMKVDDNIFGKWPIIDIDGNIVLCPSIAAARHLAMLYGVREWPWLRRKEQESRMRAEQLQQRRERDAAREYGVTGESEEDEEAAARLLETSEAEVSGESLRDIEREIARRSGVTGFFLDKRLMSSPRPYVVAV